MKPTIKYGIDFGTSNSSIALMRTDHYNTEKYSAENFKLARYGDFPLLLASEIALNKNGDIIAVGQEALDMKANQLADYFVDEIKWKLEERDVISTVTGRNSSGVELASILLDHMKKEVDMEVHSTPEGIVFGVPVGFKDSEKIRLIEAAIKAGFIEDSYEGKQSVEFVSEPIAVALEYGIQMDQDQNIMIFDFGGGTLDIVIMNMKTLNGRTEIKEHEVLAKVGGHIGGDRLTWKFFINSFIPKYGFEKLAKELKLTANLYDEKNLEKEIKSSVEGIAILNELEKCKIRLSSQYVYPFNVSKNHISIQEKFIRDDFTNSIREEINQARQKVKEAMYRANLDVQDISVVLLAGGSSFIPAFQDMLREEVKDPQKVKFTKDPMTSVSRGLAIAGFTPEGVEKKQKVNDLVDSDYGVWDSATESVSVIISKGAKVYDTVLNKETLSGIGKTYRVIDSYQRNLKLQVYQNENKINDVDVNLLENEVGDHFKIFFTVNQEKGWLQVHVYNLNKQEWKKIPFGRDKIRLDWSL